MAMETSVREDSVVVELVPRVVRGPHIVAYVMSDGSIRRPERPFEDGEATGGFESGTLSGEGWILWWDRRSMV